VIVTESMRGTDVPRSAKTSSTATRAALPTSVSKTVSTRRRSTPPSRRPRTCSA
jgi:hypothetical protein